MKIFSVNLVLFMMLLFSIGNVLESTAQETEVDEDVDLYSLGLEDLMKL